MDISKVLMKRSKLILLWGLVFALFIGIVTLFLPKQYNASTQILIISRDRTGVDPYTQAKSAERIGENLSQIIKTSDFYDKVVKSTYNFNKERWTKLDERKRRKKWDKDVNATVLYGTGIMNVTAYSNTKQDAVNITDAIGQSLASFGWEYVGGNVVLKVVSKPLIPRMPSRPNFVVNIVVGFALGVLLAAGWVVRYKRHHYFHS